MFLRYFLRLTDNACKLLPIRYTGYFPETAGNEIGVSKDSVADDRHMAVFSRPYIKHLQWSGLGEGALAHAGSHGRRYANLTMCLATPIGVGGRVPQSVRGGRSMRLNNLARTGQSQAIITASKVEQLHALLDFLRMPAVRRALQEAPAAVQSGISALANDCQAEAFAEA